MCYHTETLNQGVVLSELCDMEILKYFDFAELRKIARLALPIFLGSMASMGMAFTDTVMAGHLSAADLAGIALACTFIFTLTISGSGFALATTPVISADHGSRNYKLLLEHFYQIVFIAFGLSFATVTLLALSSLLLPFFELEPKVYRTALEYLLISLLGIPGYFVFHALRTLTEGMSYTRLTMYVSFIALFINAGLNYIFMYGKLGMPAMGGSGSAVSTVMVQTFMALFQWYRIRRISYFSMLQFRLRDFRPDFAVIGKFVRLGFRIATALFFEVAFFTFMGLVVTFMGTSMIAANQIYYNLMSIIYMLPFALSQVVAIRIGFTRGENNLDKTFRAIVTCYTAGLVLALATAVTTYLCRNYVGALYTDDPEVIAIVSGSFVIISLYQLADFCQINGIGILRGFQDNRIITVASVCVYWLIGLPVSLILCFTDWLGGPYEFRGLWSGLCVSLYVLAVIYTVRVASDMRRIKKSGWDSGR